MGRLLFVVSPSLPHSAHTPDAPGPPAAIQPGHAVIRTGPYRYVRHPSYTGLFLAFLGLGLYFHNWLSLLVLLVPVSLALANRVAKEEAALRASLGHEYAAYCARTKRFIPWLL